MPVLLWLCFAVSLSLSSVEGSCYGEFTAELRGRELWLGSTCKSSCSGSADSINMPCEIVSGTVSPFVYLDTCLFPGASLSYRDSDSSSSTAAAAPSHTLVTHLVQEADCTATGECYWKLELPERFFASPCIDVCVTDFTTTSPPLRGIRKRLWLTTYDQSPTDITCEGVCNMLDNDTHDYNSITVALILQNNSYHILYRSRDANFTEVLPRCLQDMGELEWSAVESSACSGDDHHTFTPSRVYAVSSIEVVVTGNNSLLYSPCRRCMWYQLLLPASENITSFTYISNVFYTFLTTNSEDEDVGVWVGIIGWSPVFQVYPSPALEWLWDITSTSLNHILASASLAVDTQGNLVAISGSSEIQLPLPILLSHALYNYHLTTANSTLPSSLHLLANQDGPSLEDRPHPLLHQSPSSLVCPLADVRVEAPICSRVTRSVVDVERTGVLAMVDSGSLPWVNCSVMSDALPHRVFLRLGESYTFTVQLVVNPVIAADTEVDDLVLVSTVSMPDVVQVVTEGAFHPINNTMSYQVSFVEKNASSTQPQVPPGTILKSVDVYLQAGGVDMMACAHPLDSHPKLLGRLHTSVHVGCPPGLSLVFDDVTTQSHDNHFCSPTANISCYYFGNEFRPVMQLVDLVTGNHSTYTGPYTLRMLAGGTSSSAMTTFNAGQNIESHVWTVSASDILSHSNNKIEWVCGPGSPCGEIIPGGGRSPEYYLHLQASNRDVGQHETYCDLTVEFTIRLHGLSMGPITTSVTLILLLVLLVVPLLSLFSVWVWRERRGDEGVWGGWRRGIDKGSELVGHLQCWLEELAKKYQQTPPLEPHLHTD